MKSLLAALAITGLAACGTTEEEPTYGDGLGTPESPIPNDESSYIVTSRIDVTSGGTVPTQVTTIVDKLRTFSQSPGRTLLGLAASPELTALTASLPSTLVTRLEGWLDTEIDKLVLSGKTMRQVSTEVAGFAETSLTKFGLDSTLVFSPTRTSHTLTGVSFRLAGLDVVIPIGGLKADAIGQHTNVTVAEAGSVSFGEHKFGLAFGNHAWHGINLASTSVFGADVRTTIGKAMNCRALAQAIAGKCVYSSCVGHQTELTAVCDKAVDVLVTELQSRITTFDFGELRLSGTGKLVDKNLDGLADRIDDGVWQSQMSLGSARGTFTALAR